MTTALSPVIASRLEKAAVDNGFDQEQPREGDWLGFASTQCPLRTWLGTFGDAVFLATFSQQNVARALGHRNYFFKADGRGVGATELLAGLAARTTAVTAPSRGLPRRSGLDIGSLGFCLDGTQGLDEGLCSRRQGPAAKIEHAVSRSHFRHAAVKLDEAPRRHVLGKQRGGARENGVAVKRDQPGVC
jgi:hypothetical protein